MTRDGEVGYARSSGEIDIAYKVMGDGPLDLVFVSGFVSHLDHSATIAFSGSVRDIARPCFGFVEPFFAYARARSHGSRASSMNAIVSNH